MEMKAVAPSGDIKVREDLKARSQQIAEEQVATRNDYLKGADQEWEEFVKTSEEGTLQYSSRVNAFVQAMKGRDVDIHKIEATLYSNGLEAAAHGVPASQFRAAMSLQINEIIAEGDKVLDAVAAHINRSLELPPEKTKEEIKEALKKYPQLQGASDEELSLYADNTLKNMEKAKEVVEELKAEVAAQDEAVEAANVPEEERFGIIALNGFRIGEQQKRAGMETQRATMEGMKEVTAP